MDRLAAAPVCVTTGDTALTAAVTSAARCTWTCALACVQETAATPSVLSPSAWHGAASRFFPPNCLRHRRPSKPACHNATIILIECACASAKPNQT